MTYRYDIGSDNDEGMLPSTLPGVVVVIVLSLIAILISPFLPDQNQRTIK